MKLVVVRIRRLEIHTGKDLNKTHCSKAYLLNYFKMYAYTI
jgi:hypothetical protein